MDSAASRADYADARFVRTQFERLATRNGALDRLDAGESEGIGVRVRVGGAWGFAASRGRERAAAEGALARALELARAQPAAPGAPLAPEPPARGSHESPCGRDPFEVALEDKLALLHAADAKLRSATAGVSVAVARYEALRTDKVFASTEGALCEQRLTECGGGLAAVAVAGDQSQVRSWPASHGGHVTQAGYEGFVSLDLAARAPVVAE
ncbi:MAG TPA: DNA gyrase modulator, partial [Thermoleophilaceae bacterium]|nr:DNA gyrase modulator [Thermoleophilaceae bacterium]